VCNDGTPGGFYWHNGTDSGLHRFHIHLSGGFWCWDDESCDERWNYPVFGRAFMSSEGMPKRMPFGGIFSRDPGENPEWANVNTAIGAYCSSDSWSGNRTKEESGSWEFQGRNNVLAMMGTLLTHYSLGDATHVLISGCSAGGMGVIANVDWMREWLLEELPNVQQIVATVDAGWFLDIPLYPNHGPRAGFNNTVISQLEQVQLGYPYWGSMVDSSCAHALGDEAYKCLLAQYAYKYLETDVFFHQEQYDSWQLSWNMGIDQTDRDWDAGQEEYARDFMEETNESLEQIRTPDGLFSMSCYGHCFLMDNSFFQVTNLENPISSYERVLHEFVAGNSTEVRDACHTVDCASNCPGY